MAGIFNEAVLTTKGIALLAKAQAGRCTISLTKAQTGDGAYASGEDLKARTALKSQRQTFPLITVRTQNATNVYVKFIITNKPESGGNLAQGYYVKEVGLFATDPDEGEILYAIATAVENQWDYMPSYNNLLPSTITLEFLTEVSNAANVTIVAPNETFLYDKATGDKYVLGIENGLMFYEEVEE
ncbi:MAG: phage tail protein [Lachnospiraceae bacterium]